MHEKPLISIVIPTYNRAKELKRALKSVLAQTYSHWEALVVDNQSSDNTDAVVHELGDSRIKLLKIQNNGVIAASRNLGIKNAVGKYIAFLDSDDWWMPEKLEESLKYLEQGADVVYHDLFLVMKDKQRLFWRKACSRNLTEPVFNDLLVNGNGLNNSSVVVRRDLLNAIDGLSEHMNLVAAEDYEAWLKIARLTEKFKKIPRVLGYYWAGGQNMSNPNRTLTNLKSIEESFAHEIGELVGTGCPSWMDYARGVAYFHLRSCEMARKSLQRIPWQPSKMFIKIKSFWILLLIRFQKISTIKFNGV